MALATEDKVLCQLCRQVKLNPGSDQICSSCKSLQADFSDRPEKEIRQIAKTYLGYARTHRTGSYTEDLRTFAERVRKEGLERVKEAIKNNANTDDELTITPGTCVCGTRVTSGYFCSTCKAWVDDLRQKLPTSIESEAVRILILWKSRKTFIRIKNQGKGKSKKQLGDLFRNIYFRRIIVELTSLTEIPSIPAAPTPPRIRQITGRRKAPTPSTPREIQTAPPTPPSTPVSLEPSPPAPSRENPAPPEPVKPDPPKFSPKTLGDKPPEPPGSKNSGQKKKGEAVGEKNDERKRRDAFIAWKGNIKKTYPQTTKLTDEDWEELNRKRERYIKKEGASGGSAMKAARRFTGEVLPGILEDHPTLKGATPGKGKVSVSRKKTTTKRAGKKDKATEDGVIGKITALNEELTDRLQSIQGAKERVQEITTELQELSGQL